MYALYPAPPHLAPFVDCFWESRFDVQQGRVYDELFVAQSMPNIIINLSADYQRNATRMGGAVVEGTNTAPIRFAHGRENALFGIRFRAWGLAAFSKLGMHELLDTAADLEQVFGQRGREFAEAVNEAQSTSQRIALAEVFLWRTLDERALDRCRLLAAAYANIAAQCHKPGSITRAFQDLNATHRTLDRHFRQMLGLPPKRLSRLLRFQKTFSAFHQRGFRLSELNIYGLGYYDTAHFSKDFKTFTGLSPQHYLASPYFVQNLQGNHF